ncbi:unnamed protein product, partial [marine sediment metagenome]
MNKKGFTTMWLVVFAVTAFIGAFVLVAISQYATEWRECKDYNSYGYYTEVIGGWWDHFDGRDICLITMEDGTKLPLNDF